MDRLPPLNGLRAFTVAARRLSFTAAASELHVTHGAVSRQIAKLEDFLGTPLFTRTTRGLLLTDKGATLARAVTAAFDTVLAAVTQIRSSQPAAELRLSVPPTLAVRWLIPRMANLHQQLPSLRLEITTSTAPPDFGTNAYDAAIRRVTRATKGLRTEAFLHAAPVAVCSPAYQRREKLRLPEGLRRATLIVTRSEPHAWPDWLRKRGLPEPKPDQVLAFEELYFSLQAALDTLGVALVPAALVTTEIEQGRLVAIPDHEAGPGPRYALVWPRNSSQQQAAAGLAEWLKVQGDL